MVKITFILFTVILSSCAHKLNSKNSDSNSKDKIIESYRFDEKSTIQENSQDKQIYEVENNIPVEVNSHVQKWIRYFQGRGRPHMERYLARSSRYETLMKKVLTDNDLPTDLFYIALIESGFSSRARSHASAVGYWQFIRGTGKRYDLRIDRMIDERHDPELATRAAAEYFKDLYSRFNSWYLAMASYNVGEGRIGRVIKKYKTNDFWKLAKTRKALPRETQDYVPKYIAAKLIAKNPTEYGFGQIDYLPPISFDTLEFHETVNLRQIAEKIQFNYEDFKDLNPKFKGEIAPAQNGKLLLRIPAGYLAAALTAAQTSIATVDEFVPDRIEYEIYRVRRGDTLSSIARRYRTNIAYLKEINSFNSKKALRIGQRLFVPDRTPLELKSTAKKKAKVHIVKRGDSLTKISQKYGVAVSKLRKKNKLKKDSYLLPGMKVIIATN